MNQFSEQKRQFLEHLKHERGRSEKTVTDYNRYLDHFFAFSKVKNVEEITEERIVSFRQYLDHQPGTKLGGRMEPMKRHTQNGYLTAIRMFLKFLHRQGIKALSPEHITLEKDPQQLVDYISMTELKRLMTTIDQQSLEGMRDKSIIEVFISTGLSVSELCELSINDLNLSKKELRVRGSNNKERIVSLSESASASLQKYLKARKDLHDPMFVRYGRKMHDGGNPRITPRMVQRLIKQYATQAGIARQVTPRSLRHSFAVTLLKNGTSVNRVQELLGYGNDSTTRQYMKTLARSLKRGREC